MRFVHYLQHWLGGTGIRLQVTDFVPVMHPIRQWASASALSILNFRVSMHQNPCFT